MKNNIVSNAGWIIGCKIIKAILTLIVTMFTARYLGPSSYGLISYAASIVVFITPLMKLGFESILVHEIVQKPENEGKILGTAIFANIISSCFAIAAILLFVFVVNHGEKDTLIVCGLYSLLLLFQAIENLQYWFQAKLMSKYTSISMLISYVIITIFQIILLILNKNVYWFALSYSLDYFIIAILLLLIYRKKGKSKLEFSKIEFKRMFSISKYYIVSSMMVNIFAQTDRIMLKLMIDNAAVGYYSAATTCATMTAFVFVAIIDSFRPSIFEGKKISQQLFNERLKYLYFIIIYASLITSMIMTFFAPLIIKIIYGRDFSESILALQIIVWFTTFSYLGTIRNIWMLAEQKQKYLWIINLSGALANILLNLILIPYYGIYGAAFASLFTQIFTNLIIGFIMKPIRENNKIMINALNPKLILDIKEKLWKGT